MFEELCNVLITTAKMLGYTIKKDMFDTDEGLVRYLDIYGEEHKEFSVYWEEDSEMFYVYKDDCRIKESRELNEIREIMMELM